MSVEFCHKEAQNAQNDKSGNDKSVFLFVPYVPFCGQFVTCTITKALLESGFVA